MEGKAKTPAGKAEQVRPRRRQATRRLTGRPRKAKPCTEINCGVISDLYELMYPICSSLGWVHFVMFQPFLCIINESLT
ncbi:hypothetical protein BMQ_1160 [Priestia megaterium QM B1551]|uniref:Uncharacterized protein n=1 Tax=Priestia megaterium (strain ATCC 12872 / QMB1551) TaxID=545693 RepID=D5DZ29_PRIM1|nr:hypothetical protein BMQ_1160 [Priestia megaterium QM B1551]